MYQKPEVLKSFDIANIEGTDNTIFADAWGAYGNYSASWLNS